jgi:hypothetical protein
MLYRIYWKNILSGSHDLDARHFAAPVGPSQQTYRAGFKHLPKPFAQLRRQPVIEGREKPRAGNRRPELADKLSQPTISEPLRQLRYFAIDGAVDRRGERFAAIIRPEPKKFCSDVFDARIAATH